MTCYMKGSTAEDFIGPRHFDNDVNEAYLQNLKKVQGLSTDRATWQDQRAKALEDHVRGDLIR